MAHDDTMADEQAPGPVTLGRAELALAALASTTESTRLALQVLRVERGQLLATDGHCAGILEAPKLAALTACSLDAPACLAAGKALGKHGGLVAIAESNANGHVELTAGATTLRIPKSDDAPTFPDFTQVIPTGTPVVSIGFNAVLLAHVLTTAIAMADKGKRKGKGKAPVVGVRLDFYADATGGTGLRPVKITGTTGDGRTMTFVVMPMRL